MNIAVIGLGKLGSPLAATLAEKGHYVIGVDLNSAFVEAVNAGRAPVEEPDLQTAIDRAGPRLRATTSTVEAVRASDATFIIVPTPSMADGLFTNEYVIRAMNELGPALREHDRYHLVVVTSTVLPGATGGPIREALERASGRVVGSNLGLCYNPEFIALGSVIRNTRNPDMVLIGESDTRAGELLAEIHHSIVDNEPAIHRMNWVNAELTKISVNTFVTTKISYANMLAAVCDRLPGSDVDVVSDAIGADSRIGRKYLTGGMGYGGPCFPRDNVAFSALARRLGVRADLAEATDRMNAYQLERMRDLVIRLAPRGGSVAVLGLSYKPHTAVIEQSHGVALASQLLEQGFTVHIHDPQAAPAAAAALDGRVSVADSAEVAIANADVAIVMTLWPEYRSLNFDVVNRRSKSLILVDCWRMFGTEVGANVNVVHVGRGSAAGGM